MAEKVTAGKSQTEAEKRINFSVLKKHDDKIDKIIDTASSVAHYKFNSLSGVWVSPSVSVNTVNIVKIFHFSFFFTFLLLASLVT